LSAYPRVSTAKFYEWLEESKGKLPAGPCIWICGDCHVGNLGPLADFDANVNIQIRDLTSLIWRKTNSSRSISRKISALRVSWQRASVSGPQLFQTFPAVRWIPWPNSSPRMRFVCRRRSRSSVARSRET
jgi:hypothetical protein